MKNVKKITVKIIQIFHRIFERRTSHINDFSTIVQLICDVEAKILQNHSFINKHPRKFSSVPQF